MKNLTYFKGGQNKEKTAETYKMMMVRLSQDYLYFGIRMTNKGKLASNGKRVGDFTEKDLKLEFGISLNEEISQLLAFLNDFKKISMLHKTDKVSKALMLEKTEQYGVVFTFRDDHQKVSEKSLTIQFNFNFGEILMMKMYIENALKLYWNK